MLREILWTDSTGLKYTIRISDMYNDHVFTPDELLRLAKGENITFQTGCETHTGHIQYIKKNEEYGFVSSYDKDVYIDNPVYTPRNQREIDTQREVAVSEYMRLHFYKTLINDNGTAVNDYRRYTDRKNQLNGVDVTFTMNQLQHIVDEKASVDDRYLYDMTLNTFVLELYQTKYNRDGWFLNNELMTQYYMFIWPRAVKANDRELLLPDDIKFAYYALVNKHNLQKRVTERLEMTLEELGECARKFVKGDIKPSREGNGVKYLETRPFDSDFCLCWTANVGHRPERPVNLKVKRSFLNDNSLKYGILRQN